MATIKKKPDFFTSDEGMLAAETLIAMANNPAYYTESSYSADKVAYPNHLIPFVDKHMNYLRNHPATDPRQYLANLRLMTKLK